MMRPLTRITLFPYTTLFRSLEEITENFNTAMNISVSSRTIQRTLHNKGYSGHAAKKKPFISEKNQKKRYGWCRVRKNWNDEDRKSTRLNSSHSPTSYAAFSL